MVSDLWLGTCSVLLISRMEDKGNVLIEHIEMSRTMRHRLRCVGMKGCRMLIRTWEMSQLLQCLLHKHKALSLVPRIHIEPRCHSGYITLA